MGTILTGELGAVVSATAGSDLEQLLVTALRDTTLSYKEDATIEDTSGKGDGYMTRAVGLRSGTLNFEGLYPRSSPRFGASGLFTLTGTTFTQVESYTLDIDWGEEEITGMASAGVTSRSYMPLGYPEFKASIVCRADSASALPSTTALHGSAANIAFKLTEDGTDPAFTGSAVGLIASKGVQSGQRGAIKPTYDVMLTGQLTSVAGSTLPALLPAGTVDRSDWDTNSDGSADVQLVWKVATGRTYTSYAFLRSLRVVVAVNQLIRVSGVIRLTGDIATA